MLEEKDKEFVKDMWGLEERDIYNDNRNTTLIAPNSEADAIEMRMFLKEKYKVYLYKRSANRYHCAHTLVRVTKRK